MAVTQTPSTRKKGQRTFPTKEACGLGELKITLVRSLVSRPMPQRLVVRGLGLRKLNSTVIRKDCPEIRGMINKVPHLLKVEALEKK